MQKLAVVVTTPPYSNLTATAIEFVEAVVSQNIQIIGIFFYQQGVLNASKVLSVPSDEFQAITRWAEISQQHQIPLHLCITAAEKHGLSDELETSNLSNISDNFIVSGLGELVEHTNAADRVVQL
ncbi:sulfurtransferase complex subunit TusD [Colwelliaceae bacterium 6471]